MNQWKLLVVDDDPIITQSIKMNLSKYWYMHACDSPNELPEAYFDAALVDMHLTGKMNKSEGLEVLKKLHELHPNMELIAISGDINRELMESCIKNGASRFLAKPIQKEELENLLDKIITFKQLQNISNHSIKSKHWVGNSEPSKQVKKWIANMAGEKGPFLIEGETGTGKEVIAQLFAQQNPDQSFISINAAAIPENVFESEFFGHVKGAFTGADSNKMGFAEAADGGFLFIDEIEALPLSQQAKLLRFLESGEIRRVGSEKTIHTDVKIICASNRNLKEMVEDKEFREDLLYRISAQSITLPPLRTRTEDILDLANYFISLESHFRKKEIQEDGLQILCKYDWPGNVRELKRVIEQSCLHAPLPILRKEDFEKFIQPVNITKSNDKINVNLGLACLMASFEKQVIEKTLEIEADIDLAAKILGISRSSLYKKVKDHGIESK